MFVFSNLKWIFDIEIWRKHAGKHISLEFLNFNIDFIYNNLHNIWRIHSSQNPVLQICSLLRGGIAERGGVRVGHRIIEINGQSVVAVPHERIVNLLATSVGEVSAQQPRWAEFGNTAFTDDSSTFDCPPNIMKKLAFVGSSFQNRVCIMTKKYKTIKFIG